MGDSLEGTTAMSAALGGTISSLSGGSFTSLRLFKRCYSIAPKLAKSKNAFCQNGAMTATFAHLYNDQGDHYDGDLAKSAAKERKLILKLSNEQFIDKTGYEGSEPGIDMARLSVDTKLRNMAIVGFSRHVLETAPVMIVPTSRNPISHVFNGIKAIFDIINTSDSYGFDYQYSSETNDILIQPYRK